MTVVFLNNVTNSKLFSNFKLSDYNGLFFSQKIGFLVIKGKVFPAAVKPHNSTPAYMVILPKKYSIFDSEKHFLNCFHDGNQVN